jgi:rubrerythrin
MTIEKKMTSDILQMAIAREQDAYFFYMDICDRVKDDGVKETLSWIADEEKKHRKFLVDYRNGKFGNIGFRMSEVVEYKIAEHVEEPEILEEMDIVQAYLVASHRELTSYTFYTELAGITPEENIRSMLLSIANEELKHKEKMEYLYTNTAFPQTSGG